MRERKYVKFKVAMYDDTKFKIIDMKPERDLIHYVWTRLVILAGKVNLEGDLYLSKNIPYTIETLAIEFNRSASQIKIALDVFIELEMLEITKDRIYRVKNFAKHQNIKIKEKNKSKDREEYIKKTEVQVNENLKDEIHENKDKELGSKISKDEVENIKNNDNLEITHKDINKVNNNASSERKSDNLQDNVPIILETKKGRRNNKNKKDKTMDINVIDGENEDNSICSFTNGVPPLRDGERAILELSFG